MEHRCGTRRTIDARVVIDGRPGGLIHGRIKNISPGGLYIKMQPRRGLASDNVKVVLVRRLGRVCRLYRLPAIVIRWGHDGAGLMFRDLTSNAFYALLSILLADEQREAAQAARRNKLQKRATTPASPSGSWSNKCDS